jgi:hypothetical protein
MHARRLPTYRMGYVPLRTLSDVGFCNTAKHVVPRTFTDFDIQDWCGLHSPYSLGYCVAQACDILVIQDFEEE